MEKPYSSERLIFRLFDVVQRQLEELAIKQLKTLITEEFNIIFLPYFMSIGENGISNHELLAKIRVTKQGVSKVVKELERLGLIYTSKNENDARSIMVHLSEKGKVLHKAILKMGNATAEEYKKLLGKRKFEQLIDAMLILESHNEHHLQ
jgi:DNA-binding MarR family transcriptional regulator